MVRVPNMRSERASNGSCHLASSSCGWMRALGSDPGTDGLLPLALKCGEVDLSAMGSLESTNVGPHGKLAPATRLAQARPRSIVGAIEARTGQRNVPGRTLLFIDEVQACEDAPTLLKYCPESA